MRIKSAPAGFFLLEALISISLLALGVLALAEAFDANRRADKSYRERKVLAGCAQEKILGEIIGMAAEQSVCSGHGSWKIVRRDSRGLEEITMTAVNEDHGYTREEFFELIRAR